MKQIFDSMAIELAKAAAEAKCVEILVDAQKICAEIVNNASRFRVKKGKKL